MASAEPLPSGRFRGIYYINGEKQRIKGTFRLESEAKKAAQEAEILASRQARAGAGISQASITFGELWELMKPDRNFDSLTSIIDERIMRIHVLPRWEKIALNEILHDDIQDWVNSCEAKRTPRGSRYKPSAVSAIYARLTVVIN